MAVSDKRLQELLEIMLNNQDDNGWCNLPKDITEEEEDAIYKSITLSAMREKIDMVLSAMTETFGFIYKLVEVRDEHGFDEFESIKYSKTLESIKEDAQNMLIDLHSNNKVLEFFRIELISDNTDKGEKDKKDAMKEIEDLIENEFKSDIDRIKENATKLIDLSDKTLSLFTEQ